MKRGAMRTHLFTLMLACMLITSTAFVLAESGSDSSGSGSSGSSSGSGSSDSGSSGTSGSSDSAVGVSVKTPVANADVKTETRVRVETQENGTRTRIEERREQRGDEVRERQGARVEERDRRSKSIAEFRARIRENGQLRIEGKEIIVKELSPERKELIAGKINARTGLNLTAEDIGNATTGAILRAFLSNGRHALVKVMPDRASAIALTRLRAKCTERNCSVELKEVGAGNKTRLAYVIETEKDSRVFFLFRNKMLVKAEVDAETGEIIAVKKPWWAFFAREPPVTDAEIAADVGLGASASTPVSVNISTNISANVSA